MTLPWNEISYSIDTNQVIISAPGPQGPPGPYAASVQYATNSGSSTYSASSIFSNTSASVVSASGIPIRFYGSFYDTTIQTNPIASSINAMRFNTVSGSNGVGLLSASQVQVYNSGVYNIQFSAQVQKTDGGTDDVDIWLVVNGNPVQYTNTNISLAGNGAKTVAAWNFVEYLNKNDNFSIYWSSPDTAVRMYSTASATGPIRPGIPSVILTVVQV